MSDPFFLDSVNNEPKDIELHECSVCEAQYSVLLGEDFLNEHINYCPFCGDYIVRD